MLCVPAGACATPQTDDSAAAAERRRIAERLRKGEDVVVNQRGTLHEPGVAPDGSPADDEYVDGDVELVVPAGKLACAAVA